MGQNCGGPEIVMHCLFEVLEGRRERSASGLWFHRWEKWGIKELRCAVGMVCVSLTRRELLEEHVHSGVAAESQRTERAEEAILENRRHKIERPPTCLWCESNRLCVLASLWNIPIILRALDAREWRRDKYDAGMPAHIGESHSIELWTKTLYCTGWPQCLVTPCKKLWHCLLSYELITLKGSTSYSTYICSTLLLYYTFYSIWHRP